MPSRLGALAGRYLLTRLLGQDAAISTFEGLDSQQDWPVLIKLLPKALAADPDRQQRLQNLAEKLIGLEHPNILSIIDAGLEEGVPYLIAEGVTATSLAEKMDQPLDIDRAANIITQLGQALTHAYRQGLVHGNLSPQNVLLTSADRVLITDLGLESVLETPWEQVQERLAPYIAPERIGGWLPDARTDVYALGVMLYEMLTGLHLDSPLQQAIPWLHETVPDIAPALEPVLIRALSTDPQTRYATIGDFIEALQPILAPYLQLPEPSPPPPSPASQPVTAKPETRPPLSEIPVRFITPAMEGIPPITMPEPPPMPTFDWDAFSRSIATIHLPEPLPPSVPPPLPKIRVEGMELLTITPPPVEESESSSKDINEKVPPPAQQTLTTKKEPALAARGTVPARGVKKTIKPKDEIVRSRPQDQSQPPGSTPTPQRGRSREQRGRWLRLLSILVAILLFLTLCCCWIFITSGTGEQENTPLSRIPDIVLTRQISCQNDCLQMLRTDSIAWPILAHTALSVSQYHTRGTTF